MRPDKLYILIREDLSPGAKLAQACHGMRQWSQDHPERDQQWFQESNTVAILGLKDSTHLRKIHKKAESLGIPHAIFHEPDMDNEPTCLVLGPAPLTRKLTKNLPLAG